MNRRTFEGPMDWEYQNNRGPVDMSSPFSQIGHRPFAASAVSGVSPSRPAKPGNPFASLGANNAPTQNPPSPSKQQFLRPPSSSIFNPSGAKTFPAAAPFRNPSFMTPQKRADEAMSEYSAAEESPAMASDVSEYPGETPDYDRYNRNMDILTITPASAVSRKLFSEPKSPTAAALSSRLPGRGEVPRGKLEQIFGRRDRVRKRKRQAGDKDVGSLRSRFNSAYTSDEETDYSDASERTTGRWRGDKGKHGNRGAEPGAEVNRGVIGNMFAVIHDHPNVPLILSWWVQLGINVFFVGVFMWFVWGGISMMRADISHAADAARTRLLSEMNACAHEYTKNRCAPKNERLPALNMVCDEWEVCMSQDPSSVMKMQVSAKNVAEIINEFVGTMSIKAWGFMISAMLAMVLASNLGFSRFRETAFVNNNGHGSAAAHQSYPSQPAGAPMLPPSQDPNQAYIWAPIGQTPRHIRREFIAGTPTDTDATDASPEPVRQAIMAPPQTPSFRRSPSKGDRSRSPTKAVRRSPSKGY